MSNADDTDTVQRSAYQRRPTPPPTSKTTTTSGHRTWVAPRAERTKEQEEAKASKSSKRTHRGARAARRARKLCVRASEEEKRQTVFRCSLSTRLSRVRPFAPRSILNGNLCLFVEFEVNSRLGRHSNQSQASMVSVLLRETGHMADTSHSR